MSSYGPENEEALQQLRHHWGDAYDIEQTGPRTWLAARRDGGGALHANDADELERAIGRDYLARPVPRDDDRERVPLDNRQLTERLEELESDVTAMDDRLQESVHMLVRVIASLTAQLYPETERTPLQRYDRQAHLLWYDRTHPGAENWPPYPRTDEEAARYIADYTG